MWLNCVDLRNSGNVTPSAFFREAKRVLGPGVTHWSDHCLPGPAPLPRLCIPAAGSRGPPMSLGGALCSGHSPVWNACLGGEEMVQGLERGVETCLLGSDAGHWCFKGWWSQLSELAISQSQRALPLWPPWVSPRRTVLGISISLSSARPAEPRKPDQKTICCFL